MLFRSRSSGTGVIKTTQGTDIEVNYVDFRDGSGETIEVGDGAGVRATTGSISLDRTVFPVPFGKLGDYNVGTNATTPNGASVFPIHSTGIDGFITTADETIGEGDLNIHVRVADEDFNFGPFGTDNIIVGPGTVKVSVSRGADTVVLATAGSFAPIAGVITVGSTPITGTTRELGPIQEISGTRSEERRVGKECRL